MNGTMAVSTVADYRDSLDGWFQVGTLKKWESCVWSMMAGGSKWCHGSDARSFWNWLYHWSEKMTSLQVWGWDMWKSWCVLGGTGEIADGRLQIDMGRDCFVASDPPTIITCSNGKKRLLFIDLGNLGIDREHYDIRDGRAVLPAAKMAVQDYRAMCKQFDMGKPCLTAASQAWHIFERHYPLAEPSSASIVKLEEAAYFGGHNRCDRIGTITEKLYALDISSMYTSIGLTAMFPVEYLGFSKDANFTNQLAIADVTIKTPRPWYPAREYVRVNYLHEPDSGAYGERIIYPTGEFRTALCGPELSIAMANGHVKDWHRVQYYRPAPLMAEWSRWALATRQSVASDGKLRRLSKCFKRIINSLPGKWGQRDVTWTAYPMMNGNCGEWHRHYGRNPETGVMTEFRTIAGQCQYQSKSELSIKSCPAVAAYWTSYGRVMRLSLELMVTDALGPDHMFYTHTDSLIVSEEGYLLLKDKVGISDAAEPGRLRLIGVSHETKFVNLNNYLFDGQWTRAGDFDEDDQQAGRLDEQMRAGHGAGEATRTVQASKPNEYRYGDVTEEGIVRPFVVGPKDESTDALHGNNLPEVQDGRRLLPSRCSPLSIPLDGE